MATRRLPASQRPPRRGRIFLSYARADDARAPFVATLHAAFADAGFEAWWDRVDMPGRGLSFLQEIRDAIDTRDRVVVLVGPGALRSDYVRAEWQYALAVGKVVNPILVAGRLDHLPAELRNLDCPDASTPGRRRRAVDHLLQSLADPVPALGALLGVVPEVPAHFQPRVDEITALADCALIDTRRPVVTRPEQRITVVHGMPGAGKSALAAAFARSTEVRRAFGGGVVWVRCGREATPARVVARVCSATGVALPPPRGGADLGAALRPALETMVRLVVLDDVWSLDCILPFVASLGPRSRLVATTRLAELQTSLGCLGLLVGSLSEQAALRQLADWTAVPVDALPVEAVATARESGRLPFALALCGAMVRGGLRWADLLANLRAANLAFLDKRIRDYPYRNLQRAMAASIDALRREHRAAARRYLELAVFAAGTRVPVRVLGRLWAGAGPANEAAVRRTVALLQGKSLLRLVGDSADAVELHDLQWDFLAASAPQNRALHRRLLARYRRGHHAGLHTAPPGDYIVAHAAFHLEGAGDTQGLFRLIDRRWFERKFAVEALRESFQDDVERAIRLALAASRSELAALARLALIRSTVAALAVDVPGSALYVLARCGQTDLALDAARLSDDELSQAHFHSLVASGLRDCGDIARALQVAAMVVEQGGMVEGQRCNVLAWAAQLLAETGDAGADAAIDRAWAACAADATVLPVTAAMVQTATAALAGGRRADLRRMLFAAEAAWNRHSRDDDHDDSLADVAAGWMRAGDMPRALRLIDSRVGRWRHDGGVRSWSPPVAVLGRFALECAEAERPRDAARVWARCNARDRRDHDWPWFAAVIAARLGQPADAGRWARRRVVGQDEPERTQTLASTYADVAANLAAAGRRRDALRLVDRALVLRERALRGPAGTTRSARRVTIGDALRDRRHSEIACTLAETLVDCGEPARAEALAHEALLASASFHWELRQVGNAEAAIAIVHARHRRGTRAMAIAQAIADDYARDECFAGLVHTFAAGGRVDAALRAARSIDSESYSDWHRSRVLADDALPALPPELLPRAAASVVAAISDADARCRALAWLALRLPGAWFEAAVRAWADADPPCTDPAAMLAVARAARGRPEEPGIRQLIDERLFDLPDTKHHSMIVAAETAAHVLALWGERAASAHLVAAADGDDHEYAAAALSRVALVFVDAGWIDEARRAAARAAARAARIGNGLPYGTGDACARLARLMHRLGEPERALGFVRTAIAALAPRSGSTSAFATPGGQLEAIGAQLLDLLDPEPALRTIVDVALPDAGPAGDTAHATLGLFAAVLGRYGARAARRLEASIEASRAGCPSWLRVRIAAAWHQHGDPRGAVDRLAKALAQASQQGPETTLDVVTQGATIFGAIDPGRSLEQVYGALRELQQWAAVARPAAPAPAVTPRR